MTAEQDVTVSVFLGGVQKGGTTSLHSYFAEHPDLFSPTKKETHFFDDEKTVDWDHPDYDRFHHRFYKGFQGNRRAYDATPIYIFWPPSIDRILTYNPEARFVFLFRDPVERAFSHWAMEHGRGAETMPFSAAIRHGRWRLRGVPPLAPEWRVFSYVERGMYGHQTQRLLDRCDPSRMLFLLSQELKMDPKSALDRISRFLQIGPFPDRSPRSVFARETTPETSGPSHDDVRYLHDLFRGDTQLFAKLSGLDVSSWT